MPNDINNIKNKLDNLKNQIESNAGYKQHMPSEYWMEYAGMFDYVFSMREEVVKKIRHHTDMLTSAHPHQYNNATPQFKNNIMSTYLKIKNKLPLLEFSETTSAGGFGFKYTHADNDVLINMDLIRYMEVFEKLLDNNLLKDNYNIILELGGGFGGLAAQFINNHPKIKYIIVDLPYTLYFSSSYLSEVYPYSKIYVYKDNETLPLEDYDIFLLPPWGIEVIPDNCVDLTVNQASLGEMTDPQVDYYLKNINRVTSGIFLSYNRKFNNPWNKELSGLAEKISKVFNEIVDKSVEKPSIKVRLRNILKKVLLSNIMRPFRLLLEKLRGKRLNDGAVGNVYMWMICKPK